MNYLRYHWFDMAIVLAIALAVALYITQPSDQVAYKKYFSSTDKRR
jgi:hypothetical protein